MSTHAERQAMIIAGLVQPVQLPPPAPSRATLEARADVCRACEHSNGVRRTGGTIGVKCSKCGCGTMRLDRWPCPIGRHSGI